MCSIVEQYTQIITIYNYSNIVILLYCSIIEQYYMAKIQDQFEILRKIDKSKKSTQRSLSNQLGFSLGKLNYCLKKT